MEAITKMENTGEGKQIVVSHGDQSIGVEIKADGEVKVVAHNQRKWDWPKVKEWYLAQQERPSAKKVAAQFGIPVGTVVERMYKTKEGPWKLEWANRRAGVDAMNAGHKDAADKEIAVRVQSGARSVLDAAKMLSQRSQLMLCSLKATGPGGLYTPDEIKKYDKALMNIGVSLEKASAVFKNFGINMHKLPGLYGVTIENGDDNKTGGDEPLGVAIRSIKKEKDQEELEEETKAEGGEEDSSPDKSEPLDINEKE